MKCRVCEHQTSPFMSFGEMPISNGFLLSSEFKDEYFFELKPVFCSRCFSFQIEEQPAPQLMFHDNYAFFTRTSLHMQRHFKSYADWVIGNFLNDADPFVVELGSNDGVLLENFAKRGIRHLGIEPSANVAAVAREHGVNTFVRFFGLEAGKDIAKEHGRATALLAANVMCHIADLHDIAKGADALLTADGVLIFEDPYLGAMLEQTSYDQIYDEHVHIFSALSVGNMFSRYGFELIDVLKQGTHGGSMRYVFARKGNRPVSHSVARTIKEEMNSGLHLPETYKKFRVECEASRERLLRRLKLEREAGRRVVGYGATSKSTTILNYCSIGPELVEFISDTTPLKQGKYSPGMHIPIKAYTAFCQSPPDTALLFAWNHRSEIMEKERRFGEGGGKWLTHIDKD